MTSSKRIASDLHAQRQQRSSPFHNVCHSNKVRAATQVGRTPLPQGPQVLISLKQGVDGLEAAKNNLGSRLQNNLEIALATDGGLEEFNQV
jgi:hypothetical protein